MNHFFIDVDGVKLHVADWGGSGPDILLVHANGFLGWVYRALIQYRVDRYHIYTLDLRGQGDSDKPELRDSHWQDMANDVEAVIDALGLQDFYGLGHSGGAGPTLLEILPLEIFADDPGDLVRLFHRQEMAGVWNSDECSSGNLLGDLFSNEKEGRVGLFPSENHSWTVNPVKL